MDQGKAPSMGALCRCGLGDYRQEEPLYIAYPDECTFRALLFKVCRIGRMARAAQEGVPFKEMDRSCPWIIKYYMQFQSSHAF